MDEKSINPVWTVPNVPLGPRYSVDFRYIQNCLLLYQRGGIRALLTAPIWTEYRYLQNKSATGLGKIYCICRSYVGQETEKCQLMSRN